LKKFEKDVFLLSMSRSEVKHLDLTQIKTGILSLKFNRNCYGT